MRFQPEHWLLTMAVLTGMPLLAQSRPSAPAVLETLGVAVRGHRGAVRAAAFAPAGDLAATAGAEGSIRLWDTTTGALRASIAAGTEVRSLVFGTDGSTITACGTDLTARTWDVRSGALRERVPAPPAITHPAPGGGGATFTTEPAAIQLFDRAGAQTGRFLLPPVRFEQIEWSADGRRVAAIATRQPWVFAWDVPASRPCLDQAMSFRPTGVAFSPDSQTLAVCKQGWVELRPLDGGRETRKVLVAGTPCRAGFAPDGRSLVVGTADGRVQWRDLRDARHLLPEGWEHRTEVSAVAVSPNGTLALSGGQDGRVRFWSLAEGQEAFRARGHNNQITALAFAPDGRHLLSGAWNGTLQLWDLGTGGVTLRLSHKPHVRGVGILADGSLVSAGADNTVRIWSARDGKELRRFTGPGGTHEILQLSLDAAGTRLLTSHDRTTSALWDPGRGLLQTFRTEGTATLSPDGERLVAGGNRLRAWRVAPPAGAGNAEAMGVTHIGFLGPTSVVCVLGGTIATWELDQKEPTTHVAQQPPIHDLAVHAPGGMVAVAAENAVHVHDASWEEVFRIPAADAAPNALAWSADGRILAVGWSDAVIGVYSVTR
jgi:WD40 repeat protein